MITGRPHVLLVGIALLAASMQAAAGSDIYQWKDADGKVHFTDTPPPPGATALQTVRDPSSNTGTMPGNRPPTREAFAKELSKDCSPKLDAKTCAEWSDAIARDFLELGEELSSPEAKQERLRDRRAVCTTVRPMLERAQRRQRGEEPVGTPADRDELAATIAFLERDVAEYCD